VLVSASLGAYLRPFGEMLGVDAVLCADVADDGKVYLDHLAAPNCRGREKAVRLSAWLTEHQLSADELWAYGDSPSDAPLLAMAPHPVWVTSAALAAVPDGFER
jgi:HAD superfamily phosphoserine phosphatase-like hydrolase